MMAEEKRRRARRFRCGRSRRASPSEGSSSKALALAILTAVLVASVCGCGAGQVPTDEPSGKKDPPKTSPGAQTAATDEATGLDPTEGGFVASSESSGGTAGAADRVAGVRFEVYDGYERVLINFGGGSDAPGVPEWSLDVPAEGGYVRVNLPGISSTATSGEDLIGLIMDEVYVVRAPEGGFLVDVFGMHAFRYRVTELPETGQLAVDFRPVSDELERPPTQGEKVVVLQPREAETVSSPLIVRGYSRLFEAQTTISLIDRDGEPITSTTVRANDWTAAWGYYKARLEFHGYEGLARLRVGSRSPRDGAFEGTVTEVFVE